MHAYLVFASFCNQTRHSAGGIVRGAGFFLASDEAAPEVSSRGRHSNTLESAEAKFISRGGGDFL
jgi:tagatose-1,6-bisphosphate aldolase